MLARKLRERDLNSYSYTKYTRNRQFYSYIYPISTTIDTLNYDITIRKFSPNGDFLICFSQNLHYVKVFQYSLPSKVTVEIENWNFLTGFDDYFTMVYEINLCSGSESICADFCLFTMNKKHVSNLFNIDDISHCNTFYWSQ
jgi:hypothetical protein